MNRDNAQLIARTTAFLLAFSLLLLLLVLIRTAWVSDDAYVSFRTVDNFVSGHGLTWNANERVQAFTNPLWVFLVSAVYFFSGEAFFTSILLSIVLSMLAVGEGMCRLLGVGSAVGLFHSVDGTKPSIRILLVPCSESVSP